MTTCSICNGAIPDGNAADAHTALCAAVVSAENATLRASLARALEDQKATLANLEKTIEERLHWEDADDEWTEAIKAAYPTRSGSHEQYGVAMRMVGNRHSKGALVTLVNWLLVEMDRGSAALKHENDNTLKVIHQRDEARAELEKLRMTCREWIEAVRRMSVAYDAIQKERDDARVQAHENKCLAYNAKEGGVEKQAELDEARALLRECEPYIVYSSTHVAMDLLARIREHLQ